MYELQQNERVKNTNFCVGYAIIGLMVGPFVACNIRSSEFFTFGLLWPDGTPKMDGRGVHDSYPFGVDPNFLDVMRP